MNDSLLPFTPDQPDRPDLHAHYDAMWTAAWPHVAASVVDLETHLTGGRDPGRGLTVIARPGPALAARCVAVQDRIAAAAPQQILQARADLHMTVLSLFNVTDEPAPHLAHRDAYAAGTRAAVVGLPAFDVDFTGITISRGAVVACGFPRDDTLAVLRSRLRDALRARGLGATLDERYRLVTAHMTLLRFASPPRDPAGLTAALTELRAAPLGTMRVDAVELVVNDWYMSSEALEVVERLALTGRDGDR
jgi:2'-5' RNA ligase